MTKFELKVLKNQMEYVKEMSEYLKVCDDPKEVMDRMIDIIFIANIVMANVDHKTEQIRLLEAKNKKRKKAN